MHANNYRKFYDNDTAARYARIKEESKLTNRGEHELVRRALRFVRPGETVLDLPCGAGRMTPLLAKHGLKVTAADVSPAMVELAKQRMTRERLPVEVTLADAEETKFADLAFDHVFCFRLFHHFPSAELRVQVIEELCRITRQRVLLSYFDSHSYTSMRQSIRHRIRRSTPHRWAQQPAQLEDWFANFNFRVIKDLARFPFFHTLRLVVAERCPTQDERSLSNHS